MLGAHAEQSVQNTESLFLATNVRKPSSLNGRFSPFPCGPASVLSSSSVSSHQPPSSSLPLTSDPNWQRFSLRWLLFYGRALQDCCEWFDFVAGCKQTVRNISSRSLSLACPRSLPVHCGLQAVRGIIVLGRWEAPEMPWSGLDGAWFRTKRVVD